VSADLVVAGGGIGGLAAALAAHRAGCQVRVLEQAAAFGEVGAGLQLGPNSTAILREWGLLDANRGRFAQPERLRVRDSGSGDVLGELRLGAAFEQRYGAPYLTAHRADLHRLLFDAATQAGLRLHTGRRVAGVSQSPICVTVTATEGKAVEADALIAADGLWSRVREHVIAADEPPRPTGHLAYRGMMEMAAARPSFRGNEVQAWLGPALHVVTYPVRGGELLNVVCVVEGSAVGDPRGWDNEALAGDVRAALANACTPLRDLAGAVPHWRLWSLHARAPVPGAAAMAAGRIALLGDAAHPMLPYLAQGAGMALEDARELQRVLVAVRDDAMDVPTALKRYALNRWQRCARVQRRSQRNGVIFHASGPLRWARDSTMRIAGERLLDLPWLYGWKA
jgi:salicylate hydroxylase